LNWRVFVEGLAHWWVTFPRPQSWYFKSEIGRPGKTPT